MRPFEGVPPTAASVNGSVTDRPSATGTSAGDDSVRLPPLSARNSNASDAPPPSKLDLAKLRAGGGKENQGENAANWQLPNIQRKPQAPGEAGRHRAFGGVGGFPRRAAPGHRGAGLRAAAPSVNRHHAHPPSHQRPAEVVWSVT